MQEIDWTAITERLKEELTPLNYEQLKTLKYLSSSNGAIFLQGKGYQVKTAALLRSVVERVASGVMDRKVEVVLKLEGGFYTPQDIVRYYGSFEYLWEDWIVSKAPNLVCGYPGHGKTSFVLDLCLRMNEGKPWPWPNEGKAPAGKVIWMITEDPLGWHKRADEMGLLPNPDLILPEIEPDLTRIDKPDFRGRVEDLVRQHRPLMVILDSLTGGHTQKEISAREMRWMLTPWATMALRYGFAFVVCHHFRKPPSLEKAKKLPKPNLFSVRGSIDLTALARSVIQVWQPNEDEDKVRVWVEKGKIKPPELSFILDDRLIWQGPVAEGSDSYETKLGAAMDWLRTSLKAKPLPAKEVHGVAEKEGISPRTLKRAKKALGINSEKSQEGHWVWVLPK